jgi:hypothetical protein
MVGRYSVELVLILLCGMGLHAAEVARIGGPEVFVQFDQVGLQFHLSIADQSNIIQLTYAGGIFWITIVALIQLSILHYYVRRFPLRIIMWPSYITMGLCTALWIASSFATAFFCTPPKKIWLADMNGHCGNRQMLHLGSSVAEVILHSFIILLPIPVTRDMILSRARKVALGCIYALGIMYVFVPSYRNVIRH